MSNAWETTNDDISNVLMTFNEDFTPEQFDLDDISDQLDHDKIEREALYGDDMDTQTTYAYLEIRQQLCGCKWTPGPASPYLPTE